MRQIILARRPVEMPVLADFAIEEVSCPIPGEGELLVEAKYLSVDPLQRSRMTESAVYGATIALGDVVWGRMVGEVVQSRNAGYAEGEIVEGMLGWREYAISDGRTDKAAYAPGLTRVDPSLGPISLSLGALGMPGATAYFSLLDVGKPEPGQTVLVSAAAGAVGSLVGQIARQRGCRVVGICGSPAKAAYLTGELGFDAALDYNDPGFEDALRAACPDGVDVFMDHVGGDIRMAALRNLARGARVVLVGHIAVINGARGLVPDVVPLLMGARARMEGFIVYDYEDRLDEARREIAAWIAGGQIKVHETIIDGFENLPEAFIGMMQGSNIGKQLVRVVG